MANYGFDDLILAIDDASSDAQAITAYVTEVSGLEIEAVLEDGHTVGDSWVERLFTGLKRANEFTLKGYFDDTASVGPNALLVTGATRTFLFTWGGSKTTGFDCIIKTLDRLPARGELTKFSTTLVPTGAAAEDA